MRIYDAHCFVGIGIFKAEMFRTPREMKNEATILSQKPTFLLLARVTLANCCFQ